MIKKLRVTAEPLDHLSTSDKSQSEMDYKGRAGQRWWSVGKKDGLCGVLQSLKDVPPAYRGHYDAGHTYGMYCREGFETVSGAMA